jgi:nitroreductase
MDLATVDMLLTTTRSVRKRLDFTRPVRPEVLEDGLDIAIQAATEEDIPRYHFLVTTDLAIRTELAALYRTAMANYLLRPGTDHPVARHEARSRGSLRYLAEHLHEVPVLIQTCVEARSLRGQGRGWEFANIFPAAWCLMLALRARGLGAAWTTILAMSSEREVAALLGLPAEVRQAALIPVAHYTGEDFKPGRRIPARDRTYGNVRGQSRWAWVACRSGVCMARARHCL